jgi:TolB-like protein
MSDKLSFFTELKRRNVYKVAIAYAVVAWLLIQAASILFPTFEAPAWVMKVFVTIIILGFPVALVFSWAFEITPEGIKRESEVAPDQSVTAHTGRKIVGITVVVAVIAAGLMIFQFLRPTASTKSATGSATSGPVSEKSIAVLPFDNLSSDKDNAYFAEGIQDEILTRLSKIAALKVISRTSTQKYKSAPDNLREIGKQLGVANLLEGSVQRAADAVHINVQLIRVATDEHLWAETYNRKLNDIFAVEAEVAGTIAEQLKATLSGSEKNEITIKPTNNPAAYDAYLRGLAFAGRVDNLFPNTLNSIQAFEEAVRLDGNFALAWAQLARQESFAINLTDRSPQRFEKARHALEMAMKLSPNSAETQLAEGFYHYWVERDYKAAKGLFELFRQAHPNDYWAPYALAAIARRENQWEQSRRFFAEAIAINPQDVFVLVDASLSDIAMRDATQAQKHLARAHDLNPGNSAVISFQALAFQLTGDIAQAQAVLDQIRPAEGDENFISASVNNAILSRNYAPAAAMMRAQLQHPEALGGSLGNFRIFLGDLQRLSGDSKAATASYQLALAFFQNSVKTQPDNAALFAGLAFAEAGLGNKSAALADAQKAADLLPASKDAWVGPGNEEILARIEARFGDKENAIAAVEHLLSVSYGLPPITPALLRLDPDWDNLRGDPRFEKLAAQPLTQTH